MESPETLGQRISYLRIKDGLSQRKLMDELGFENLSKYEKDKREPKSEILKSIANYFSISLDWLMTGVENAHDGQLSRREMKIIKQLRKLDKTEQIKIEGMIELKLAESKITKKSSRTRQHDMTNNQSNNFHSK